MTTVDEDQKAGRALQALDLGERVADVCPTCGLHMIQDIVARLEWVMNGGEIKCEFCNIVKTRTTTNE